MIICIFCYLKLIYFRDAALFVYRYTLIRFAFRAGMDSVKGWNDES